MGVQASIKKLQALAQKTNLPGATSKLAQIQQMPVYSETEEVAKILKQMLADLSTRLQVLEDVDAKAQEEADKTYAKMVEWEQKLVKLADDKDKVCTAGCSYGLALRGATGFRTQRLKRVAAHGVIRCLRAIVAWRVEDAGL